MALPAAVCAPGPGTMDLSGSSRRTGARVRSQGRSWPVAGGPGKLRAAPRRPGGGWQGRAGRGCRPERVGRGRDGFPLGSCFASFSVIRSSHVVTGWPRSSVRSPRKPSCRPGAVSGKERSYLQRVSLSAPKGLHGGSPEGPADVLWGPESGAGQGADVRLGHRGPFAQPGPPPQQERKGASPSLASFGVQCLASAGPAHLSAPQLSAAAPPWAVPQRGKGPVQGGLSRRRLSSLRRPWNTEAGELFNWWVYFSAFVGLQNN